jgi:uncharacterized protein (DUF58 family)
MLLGGVASLAVAYGAVLGAGAGILVGVLGVLLVVLGISRWAVRIEVSEDSLRAGRATLPWRYTGRVLALDAEQTRRARGPEGDPTAHMVLRPGAGPGSVLVEVTDPEDPHATWLLATRHAGQLARAIEEARGRLSA